MDGCVTPRAIAYAAVQVRNSIHLFTQLMRPQLHFALADATHWMSHYNGFNYEEFYEFIVDFFEADTTPQAQEASANLLAWWNKYISASMLISTATNTEYSPGQSSQDLKTRAQPHPHQDDKHLLRSCIDSVGLPAHPTRPRSSCDTPDVHLVYKILLSFINPCHLNA